jgi:hypothetical protein
MVPGIVLDHTGIMSPTTPRRSKEMQAWSQLVSLLSGGPVQSFLCQGTLKVLGKVYDIFSPQINTSQFSASKNLAASASNLLSRTYGSPANLRMVAQTVIAKRIEYAAQFSSWTQAEYDRIDQRFSQLYRKLSSNMGTYPAVLLYLPKESGGLGYYKVSDGI